MIVFVRFSLMLSLLSLAQVAESQVLVTITSQPSSPFRVLEGQPLTLDWTYSIQGGTFLHFDFKIDGARRAIVQVFTGGIEVIRDTRFSVNGTETNATIHLLAANRSDSNNYVFEVFALEDAAEDVANLEILVLYPPSFITRASDQVVLEGGPPIQLNCVADGEPKPNITWTKVFDNGSDSDILFSGENFELSNNRSNAGTYRCNASNGIGNAVNHITTVVVNFKPENFMFKVESTSENICKGDTLNITCSAEGSPAVHTYQLFQNNILVHTSNSSELFWSNASTVGGEVMYTCEANNTASTANTTRIVTVNVPSFIMPISDVVITERGNLNLSCAATGIPQPTVFWVKTSNQERTNGTELFIRNISRSEAGEYRCEASNPCGNASESATIDVQYPPEGIQLHVSEEEVCNGTTITFNCSAETANPMELSYQLYENNAMIGVISSTGVWNKTMTVGGVFFYKCMVNNSVGTAMSSTVPVNVNVSSSIQTISDKVVREGGNLTLFCNASGIPEPLVSWVNVSNKNRTDGNKLMFENITRYEAGEYRCEATNPCGNATESTTIDVHFEPEMVVLDPSATSVCREDIIVFNCSAYSNPEVHTYELYVNGTMVNEIGRMGIWNITMATGGVFVYKCMVNNTIGTAMSMDVSVTVNEPSSVRPFTKKEIIEGENLTIICEATGTPPLTVSWIKSSDDEGTNGTELVFTYINRTEAGEYRCEASNLCGNASESVEIDVLFKPDMVQLFASDPTPCNGTSITFNCSANSNPMVHAYHLYENGKMVEQISSTGVWTRTMSTGGEFVFNCMVNNTVGTAMSPNVSVTVNEPSSIDPFTKKNVIEEEGLTIMCEATGTPPPNVSWVKTSDGVRTSGKHLVFTYINRTEAGEYRCEASNPCGNASESVEIDVFFKPEMVQLFASEETVNYGASITFNCSAYSHPMVHAYQLYENGNMVEEISSTGVWTRTMSTEGKFVFKCMVNNTVGTAMSPNVSVTVSEKCETACTPGKVCLALGTKHFCSCPYGKIGESCEQNDTLVNEVEVGFEFTNEEFKPEYENLENPITVDLIQKIKQAGT